VKLYRHSDIEEWPKGRVYRDMSWWGLAGVMAIMVAMAVIVAIPRTDSGAPLLIIVPGALALLFGTLLLLKLRVYLRKSSWLLREVEKGLWINLRSPYNAHLPEDHETVLFIPADEIAAICKTKEVRDIPSYRGGYRDVYSYIDIYLTHENTDAVAEVLHQERRVAPARGKRGGKKHHDYRVRVIDPPGIRLVWEWIKPGEEQALAALGERYAIAPNRNTKNTPWENLNEAEKEALIAELWEFGHIQQAIGLVRHHLQCSARRAQAYLHEKMGGE